MVKYFICKYNDFIIKLRHILIAFILVYGFETMEHIVKIVTHVGVMYARK